MKFWDASAIVPLLVNEVSAPRLRAVASADSAMSVWWGSKVECVSALMRLERQGSLDDGSVALALKRLDQLEAIWDEIDPNDALRDVAVRYLRVHSLRAGDALQLSAAYLAAERRPASLEFVTLDERLAGAARKEGFAVIDVGSAV